MRPRKKPNLAPRLERCASIFLDNTALTGGGQSHGLVQSAFHNPNQPMHLEIGCGKGRFIRQMALQNPEINFVAMEREANVIVIAAELALGIDAREFGAPQSEASTSGEAADEADGGISPQEGTLPKNLRFMLADAKDLDKIFAPGGLSRIYINFCDPWHKHRQFKRRLTYREWLQTYKRLLAPGGEIWFKTDNYMLYHFSTFEFDAVLPPYFKTRDLHASGLARENVMTEYEQYFSERGQNIYAIRAKNP